MDSLIKSVEKKYSQSDEVIFNSLPQTTGSYFKIVTKTPDTFISKLRNTENLQQLKSEFSSLQVDEDILIIKNEYVNYENEKKLEIKSFEIGHSQNHLISSEYYKIENKYNSNNEIKIFYSVYQEKWGNHKDYTIIRGFYLDNEFQSVIIPKEYSDWVNYTDFIVKPETPIFFDNDDTGKSSELSGYKITIIDSLVRYYETKTNKPSFREGQDFISRNKELDEWRSKKKMFSDSLFKGDPHFRELLNEALFYAEENKMSNGDLEDFTAQLISKERAFNLMRQNRQVGSCSFDNGPINQQKRIAALAAQTQNWEVFIKSFLNVMNDNVARNANSNIASNARSTYIEELVKLDLDIHKILLGSNLRIEDTINKHYFSEGDKIAKAYANLDSEKQQYFEKTIFDIINNKSIDAFNKLHFYNTYKNYQYFLNDSLQKERVEKNIEKLIPFLPYPIKSRIDNPNKQLYDLLYKERDGLDKFEVKSSVIGSIYSYSFDGDSWHAELVDKNSDGKIIYNLTMGIGEKITPLQNFLDEKDQLNSRVRKHSFLQKILNLNAQNKVYIEFTNDRSFANYRNKVTGEMPKELISILDFENAISLYIMLPNRMYVRFILLNNNNLLVLGIPKGFELPGYKFDELMTQEEKSFLSTSYKSYKLFDETGKMLN